MLAGTVPYAAFGVFDGHHGKAAAQYCSRKLVGHLMEELARCVREPMNLTFICLNSCPGNVSWVIRSDWFLIWGAAIP